MSEYNKAKNYWFKMPGDFYKRHDVKILESENPAFALFYIKLLCESVSHNGRLRFSDEIPYTNNMLSVVTGTDKETTDKAMGLLKDMGLITILEDETILMNKMDGMIGWQTEGAKRKQEQRQRGQMSPNRPPDTDTDTDIDTDFVVVNDKDKKLLELSLYIHQTGKRINAMEIWQKTNGLTEFKGKPLRDWKALVDKWIERSD